MSSTTYIPLSEQPTAHIMLLSGQHATEKSVQCCQNHGCTNGIKYQGHASRLRRILLLCSLALLVFIAGIFALSCLHGGHFSDWGLDGLLPRDTLGSSSTNGSPFVKNKLYLIVLFVGIAVVIGLGIALSFWCCKGAFNNPLCCPCYLCACCGGLACLECIGCGLCVEAVEAA